MTDDTSQESILDRLIECGVEWSKEQLKSACPPKLRTKKKCKPKAEEEETDISLPCTEKQPSKPSNHICSSCYIKKQDPYAPCCCETQELPPPCPPKHWRQPREPTCGCDLCKKKGIRSKCCDPKAYAFSRYGQQV